MKDLLEGSEEVSVDIWTRQMDLLTSETNGGISISTPPGQTGGVCCFGGEQRHSTPGYSIINYLPFGLSEISMMNLNWRELTAADVPPESLFSLLVGATELVSLSALVLTFAKNELRRQVATAIKPFPFDPKLNYSVGQSIQLPDRHVAHVVQTGLGSKLVQGQFQILAFAETHLPRLAASLAPAIAAPVSPSGPDEVEIVEHARRLLRRGDAGPHLHLLVTQALLTDKRLVGFADDWWLVEKLPYIASEADIQTVQELLDEQSSEAANLTPISSADLAQLLWMVSPAYSLQLRVAIFRLNCILAQRSDFCYLRVKGWVLRVQLPDYQVRRQLHVPCLRSHILTEVESMTETRVQLEEEQVLVQSLEEADSTEAAKSVGTDAFQDVYHWHSVAWPEAKMKLLGQIYIEGFLPPKMSGLHQVIPPSQNEVELTWLIFQQYANSEGRFDVTIDYRQEVVIDDRVAYTGSPVNAFIAVWLTATANEQTDVVHDLLAHLAGQMIGLYKQKQGHLSGFRLDLAGYLNEKQLGKPNRLYASKKPPTCAVKNHSQKLAEYQTAINLAQAQLQELAGETLNLDDFDDSTRRNGCGCCAKTWAR